MEREFLNTAVNAYMQIFDDKKPFYNVISESIRKLNLEKNEKSNLIAILGSAIRHHLLYKAIVKKLSTVENEKTFYVVAICLTDIYFTKRYSSESDINVALNYLKVNETGFNFDKFEEFAKLSSPNEIFSILKISPTKLSTFSIRYNVPDWIVDLWVKQYSKNICVKTTKNLTSKRKYFCKINKIFNLNNSIKLPADQFIKLETEKDLYEYVGKVQPRSHKLFIENKVYLTSEIENEILKKINLNTINSCAYYFYDKNNFHIELMNNLPNHANIGIFYKDFNKVAKNVEYIKKHKKDTVYYAQADCDRLEVYLSNPVNLFVLMANCSNFNNVSVSPEYLLNFEQSDLDLILRNEKDDLIAGSKHVLIGGYLVYVTHTMNKKENSGMIEEFLENNPNFSLVAEKEFLNIGKEASVLGYYAILIRNL